MGIFDRFSRLVKSNINDVIEKSEDPEKMLKQIVEELQENLLQVRTQVASAIATEKGLHQKQIQFQEEADKWQARAELAVDKGDDELAREALGRKKSSQVTADGFRSQWEEAKKSVSLLKDSLGKLEAKVSEANTKKELLIARSKRADAEQRIQQTLSKTSTSSALSAFERLESKVQDREATAAAYGELAGDDLENRFDKLSAPAGVDDDLAMLKAAREQKMLGSGDKT